MLKSLTLILELTGALNEAVELFKETVGKAREENRDVTDAELETLRSKRREAFDALAKSLGD